VEQALEPWLTIRLGADGQGEHWCLLGPPRREAARDVDEMPSAEVACLVAVTKTVSATLLPRRLESATSAQRSKATAGRNLTVWGRLRVAAGRSPVWRDGGVRLTGDPARPARVALDRRPISAAEGRAPLETHDWQIAPGRGRKSRSGGPLDGLPHGGGAGGDEAHRLRRRGGSIVPPLLRYIS
jgi:hypothetical protein